jgi:hypothetical protein
VISDARLDSKTGRLQFSSTLDGQKIRFEGTVTREAIDGMFNGQRVRLARVRDRRSSDFPPNRSILAWCKFWSSVPRCTGVRALCESLDVRASKDPGPTPLVSRPVSRP